MSMTANLIWVPFGGSNSTSQVIQYRIPSQTSNWTNFNSVGPSVTSATITGLNDNFIHEFRIVNNCAVGGSTTSVVEQKIKFVCPVISTDLTFQSIEYSFPHVGGDVSSYKVDLLNSSNSIVATKTHNSPGATITDMFTGLSGSTAYTIRVTMTAGQFSKVCDGVSVTTPATPICGAPTGLVVSITP